MSTAQPAPVTVTEPGWLVAVRHVAANLATGTGSAATALLATGNGAYALWFGIASLLLGAVATKGYLDNRNQ